MIEILQFIFQSFWYWLGTFLLLGVIVNGIVSLFRPKTIIYKNSEDKKDIEVQQ